MPTPSPNILRANDALAPNGAPRVGDSDANLATDEQHGQHGPQRTNHTSEMEADHNGPVRVLWGTHVTMSEAMGLFKRFLTQFKIKYRRSWDDERGVSAPPSAVHEDPEQLLYEH